ncbi:MAG: hypothetical protein D6710_08290 [Nitrospirae bacterium]|nr:MAG: hypothetical protein D6710_08290 [Nitrospirota bacterium]
MAGTTQESFTRTYNSFSGVDMLVTFGGTLVGELQGISYTVQREKAPIYTMGSADPRSFSRGKRGIAGSMIFMVFDRSALLEAFQDVPFLIGKSERHGGIVTDVSVPSIEIAGVGNASIGTTGPKSITLDKVLARPRYHDQILPFEVVITAANEYGSFATMRIHGVEILNVGSGMSIDDITTDEACTFVARAITPWSNQGSVITEVTTTAGLNSQVGSFQNPPMRFGAN